MAWLAAAAVAGCSGPTAEGMPGGSSPAAGEPESGGGAPENAPPVPAGAARDSAKVYWVGHSLVSYVVSPLPDAQTLNDMLGTLVRGAGYGYEQHVHALGGAPIGWNWGATDQAWPDAQPLLEPLIDPAHPDYGSFDVMVVTAGIPVTVSHPAWHGGFYARRFFCAAKAANPDVELYLYESWPHFQAGDPEYAPVYGDRSRWDFLAFLRSEHAIWETIRQQAADPTQTPEPPEGYRWRGDGPDPGECDETFDVHLVPTGGALAALIERIRERRPGDDWSYAAAIEDGRFSALDLWGNPLTHFPEDLQTTAYEGELDDIHPSHALAYFNALVHYATVYRRDPRELPAANGVPQNVANIMQEVAWQTVLDDPRTGVRAP